MAKAVHKVDRFTRLMIAFRALLFVFIKGVLSEFSLRGRGVMDSESRAATFSLELTAGWPCRQRGCALYRYPVKRALVKPVLPLRAGPHGAFAGAIRGRPAGFKIAKCKPPRSGATTPAKQVPL